MLNSNALNLPLSSQKHFDFDHHIQLGDMKIDYATGCKNSWFDIYFYLFRAYPPRSGSITFYLIERSISAPYLCAIPSGNLAAVLKQYRAFLPGEIASQAPVIASWLNTKRDAEKDVTVENGELRIYVPRFGISPKKQDVPLKVQTRLQKLVNEIILARKEADRIAESSGRQSETGNTSEDVQRDTPFFTERNLDLPNRCTIDKFDLRYLRINHSFSAKDYYLCQVKVGEGYLTFLIKPKNYLDDKCVLRANLNGPTAIVDKVYFMKDKSHLKDHYPSLFNILDVNRSTGTTVIVGDATLKPQKRVTFPANKTQLPEEIKDQIPVFLSEILTADAEAAKLVKTEKFAKDFRIWTRKEKARDATAGVSLALLLARIVLNVGDFDVSADADGDANVDVDIDTDADLSNGPADATAAAAVDAQGMAPVNAPAQNAIQIPGSGHYMFSNPFQTGSDLFSPDDLHSMGLIDDNTFNLMNNFEAKHAAVKADIDSMVADICQPVDSPSHQSQVSYDLADSQQQDALRLREEAFAKGDNAEFERQTQRVRDLQYTKETVKNTANYVSDIDVRAKLKKP